MTCEGRSKGRQPQYQNARRTWTTEDEQTMVRAWLDGERMRSIARRWEVPESYVEDVLRRWSIEVDAALGGE